MGVIQQIWNFTEYAFNYPLSFGGYSFTLWQVLLFLIIGSVLVLFIQKILLFFADLNL